MTLPPVRLTLYISGNTTYAERAIHNLRQLCEQELMGRYELTIIDVLERPEVAEHQRIVATPTLVKELPPPPWRLVGDLTDAEQLRLCLGL